LTRYGLSSQAEPDWEPGSRPVNSTIRPPRKRAQLYSHFNRSEYEVFAHHTTSVAHSGDSNGDRLLEWATNPKFKGERVRYVRMRTMGRNAVKLNIPGGVLQKVLSAWRSPTAPCTTRSSSSCILTALLAGSILSLKRCFLQARSAGMGK
jgi:hypothetical protein